MNGERKINLWGYACGLEIVISTMWGYGCGVVGWYFIGYKRCRIPLYPRDRPTVLDVDDASVYSQTHRPQCVVVVIATHVFSVGSRDAYVDERESVRVL